MGRARARVRVCCGQGRQVHRVLDAARAARRVARLGLHVSSWPLLASRPQCVFSVFPLTRTRNGRDVRAPRGCAVRPGVSAFANRPARCTAAPPPPRGTGDRAIWAALHGHVCAAPPRRRSPRGEKPRKDRAGEHARAPGSLRRRTGERTGWERAHGARRRRQRPAAARASPAEPLSQQTAREGRQWQWAAGA